MNTPERTPEVPQDEIRQRANHLLLSQARKNRTLFFSAEAGICLPISKATARKMLKAHGARVWVRYDHWGYCCLSFIPQ